MEIATQRLSLASVNPEAAKAHGDKDMVRKFLGANDRFGSTDVQFDDGERSVVTYITTLSVDRDDEVVLPAGSDLVDYRKNPVVLWAHNYDKLPLGKEVWIKVDDKGLVSKTIYAKHDEADKVFNYRKEGFPLGRSIGFIPLEWVNKGDKEFAAVVKEWESAHVKAFGAKSEKEPRRIYTKWTMLENSDCPIPSNPDAVQIAVSKGLIKPEDMKNYVLELEDTIVENKEVEPVEPVAEKVKDVEVVAPAEDEPIEDEPVEDEQKGAEPEIEKAPSMVDRLGIYDLMDKVRSALWQANGIAGYSEDDGTYLWIEDLFPGSWPDGEVLYCKGNWQVNESAYFMASYKYNDGEPTIDEPQEYTLEYRPKSWTGLVREEKAGRVLSAKNRSTIEAARGALDDVLKADKPEDGEPDEEKSVSDYVLEIEDSPKPETKAVEPEITSADIEKAIREQIGAINIDDKLQKSVELAFAKITGKASL